MTASKVDLIPSVSSRTPGPEHAASMFSPFLASHFQFFTFPPLPPFRFSVIQCKTIVYGFLHSFPNLFPSKEKKAQRSRSFCPPLRPAAGSPLSCVGCSAHAELLASSGAPELRGQGATVDPGLAASYPTSHPNLPLGNSSGTTTAEFGRTPRWRPGSNILA